MIGSQTSLYSQVLLRAAGGGVALPFANHGSLSNDLVSYWALDEVSGVRYDSVTDTGNDLTDNNTVGSDTGVNNLAASFVGASSESLSRASFVAPNSYTIAGWFKGTAADNGGNGVIAAIGSWPNSVQFSVHFATENTFRHFAGDGSGFVAATSVIPASDDDWHFFAAYFDTADKTPHIIVDDGDPDDITAPDALGGTPYRTAATLEFSTNAGPTYLTGLVDEVGIWSRVLTAQELADLYNSGAGLFYGSV